MSVLETPRIYFRGNVAWDPITTNNDPSFYDETDAEPIYNEAAKRVQAFRQEAIDAVVKGLWNPHGTHRSTFFDSAISGTDRGAGLVQNDPFINSPAIFRGMLVDFEPYGAFSSQLFFDSMTFGVAGGCRITAPRNMRFTALYINFGRNAVGAIAGVASVVWQTSFARDEGLSIDAFDSPALQALQKALDTDDVFGLTVQWSAYRTIYYGTPVQRNKDIAPLATELTKKLNSGGFQPNPARSMVVGVIGLWRKGEPAHEPSDRTLINVPNGDHTKAPTVVAAHVRITPNSIVLDLSNSVSETDLTLTKANVGDLRVVAVPSNASPVTLATFAYAQYDKTAYEKTSGILTLPITAAAAHIAESSDLHLHDSSGKVLLAESALRALPLTPNLYTSEGEKRNATIQVYDPGVRSTAGIPVLVCVMSADGGAGASTISLTTGADGTVSFGLDTAAAGITAYVPLPGLPPTLPPESIDPQINTQL